MLRELGLIGKSLVSAWCFQANILVRMEPRIGTQTGELAIQLLNLSPLLAKQSKFGVIS